MPEVLQLTQKKSSGLFEKIVALVHSGYEKKVDAIGLAIVRILYSLVLIGEIYTIDSYKELIYDPIPFVWEGEVNFHYLLWAWIAAQFMVMIGLFTRYSTVAAYVLCFACLGTSHEFEYHMYYAWLGICMLMMFIPAGRALSVDNLILKRIKGGLPMGWQQVGVINYYAISIIVAGSIYFESVFYKFASPMWQNGLGLWQPVATIQIGHANWFWIMDQQYLMYFLSWLTLAFETAYIFLAFSKFWRPWLMLVGVGLHIGIFIFFPIPFFAWGFVAILLILAPVGFWRKFIPKVAETLPPAEPNMPARWRDLAATWGMIFLLGLRINTFYTTYVVQNTLEALGLSRNRVNHYLSRVSDKVCHFMMPITGITHATVFLNFHFDDYNHVVAVRVLDGPKKGLFLPLTEEDGTPGPIMEAYTWAYFGFRKIGTHVNMGALQQGLMRGTAFWMGKTGMDPKLDEANFEVLVKKVDEADHWQKGFRKRMLDRPWLSAGTLHWKDGQFRMNVREIEAM